jgi:signal transduction histidine kinase
VPEGLLVSADRRRLREVLDNLLGNAIKYSPEGGVVELRATRQGDTALIAVSDAGIGIPRHMQRRVFLAYERDELVASQGIMGTGLGLAICKKLVEAQGGRIWVESEVGAGSTFLFTLPLAPGVEDVAF